MIYPSFFWLTCSLIFLLSVASQAQVVRERLNSSLAVGQPSVGWSKTFSADGSRLYIGADVFGKTALNTSINNGERGVYQVGATGGTPVLVRSDSSLIEGEETPDASRFIFRGSHDRFKDGVQATPLFSWPSSGGTALVLAADCDEFVLSADSNYVVYLSDDQLYSVSVTGGSASVLSAAGDEIEQFTITADSTQVVFATRVGGTGELSTVAIGGGSATVLASYSVRRFEISPSGNHVVFFGGDANLYSVPISGSGSVVSLNRPALEQSGMTFADSEAAFALVADVFVSGDEFVFYASDENTDDDGSVYRVPVAGGVVVELVDRIGLSGDADMEVFAADTSWIYFRANYDGTRDQLYRVPADGSSNTPAAASPGAIPDFDELAMDSAHSTFVYTKDADADGADDLVALDLATAIETTLSQTSLSGYGLSTVDPGVEFQITPDGLALVYLNDEDTSGIEELYYALLNGAGRHKLNSPIVSRYGLDDFALNPDGSSAYYAAVDASGSGVTEMHRSVLGTGATSTVAFSGNVNTFDVHDFLFTADRAQVVYTAYQDSSTQRDLYAAIPGSGNAPVKIGPALATSGAVHEVDLPVGSDWAICRANLLAGSIGLSGTDVVACKLDGSAQVSLSSVSSEQTAYVEAISNDGEHLLFKVSNSDEPNSSIWHADLTALPTTMVTEISSGVSAHEFVGGGVVSGDSSLAVFEVRDSETNLRQFYSVDLSTPGSPRLLWEGDRDFSTILSDDGETAWFVGDAELLEVETDGGGVTVLRSAAGSFLSLALSPDGASLAYAVSDGSYHLCLQPTGGTSYNTLLSSADFLGYAEFTPDGSRLVYGASGVTSGQLELHSIATDGTGGVKLNDTLTSGGTVSEFVVEPASQFVVYRADRDADHKHELFRVDIAGGTPVRLNDLMPSTRSVDDDWSLSPDGSYVVYLADQDSLNKFELFAAATDGSGTSKLNLGLGSSEDVLAFARSADGAATLYLADDRSTDSFELHSVYGQPNTGGIANQATTINVPMGPIGFTAFDLETPDGELGVSATSSDQSLVRDAQISITGSGTTRHITAIPEPGVWGGPVTISVVISDGVFETFETFELRITPDPNDAPLDITWPPAQLPENAPLGTAVTRLQTIDPDAWDFFEYSLVPGFGDVDNLSFRIDGDQLLSDAVFDFETRSVYTVRVRSTDFVGVWVEKVVTVNVLDLRGCPATFSEAGRKDTPIGLSPGAFTANFVLKDGGALEKIRVASLPASGQLKLRFRETVIDSAALGASAVAVGDLNGDLWLDAVAVSAGDDSLRYYRQSGTTFIPTLISSTVIGAADVAVADLNNDGALDLVTAAAGSGKIDAWMSSGGAVPTFAVVPVFTGALGAVAVKCFDYDADGDIDIVSASPGDNRVILHQNLNPGWLGSVLGASEMSVSALAIGDLDGDGDLDIACVNNASDEVAWFENRGTPSFPRYLVGSVLQPEGLAAADLDGDGDFDLVASSGTTGQVTGWFSDGMMSPSFTSHHLATGLANAGTLSVGDLDTDGQPDLLCAAGDRIVALFNRGGGFERFNISERALGASKAVMGDFDSDGRMDVLASSTMDDTIAWFEDEVLVAPGDEIATADLARFAFHPATGFVGKETFVWEGHDGASWSFGAATVEMDVYGSEYWDWLIANFGLATVSDGALKATVWGAAADADGDGDANIYEYASGTDPNDASDAGSNFSLIRADDGSGDEYLFVSYDFRKAEPDLTYTLEISEDLQTWISGVSAFTPDSQSTVDVEFEEVTEKAVNAASGTDRQFVRLKVEWALD